MQTFTLSSFLKICQTETGKQISAIDKKINTNGGYDFYNTLTKAIRIQLKAKNREAAEAILLSPSNPIEREYNMAAYERFMQRYGKKRSTQVINLKRQFTIRRHGISISCDPVFMTEESGVQMAHAIWATSSMELSNTYGGVGCYILRETYRGTELSNAKFCMANLVDSSRITESKTTNKTPTILDTDAANIARIIGGVN